MAARRVDVLGVQMDLGAGVRGVDMGPSAIRYAGLIERLTEIGWTVRDRGNVSAAVRHAIESEGPLGAARRDQAARSPPRGRAAPGRLRYADEIAACCREVQTRVARSFESGATPLLLGGDHSLAIGALAAARDALPDLRVLWFDAHGDLNTAETTPSGNVHGTPLAVALGRVPGPFDACGWTQAALGVERIALVGVRNLDPGERDLIAELGLAVYTIADVDRLGIHAVIAAALERLGAPRGSLYVSVDMDVVDPAQAPGVGTPVPGGLTVREAHLAMELVAESGQLAGLELVEINPIRDVGNQTAELAAGLALSALGKRIL